MRPPWLIEDNLEGGSCMMARFLMVKDARSFDKTSWAPQCYCRVTASCAGGDVRAPGAEPRASFNCGAARSAPV